MFLSLKISKGESSTRSSSATSGTSGSSGFGCCMISISCELISETILNRDSGAIVVICARQSVSRPEAKEPRDPVANQQLLKCEHRECRCKEA
jgi:hypothetical protein